MENILKCINANSLLVKEINTNMVRNIIKNKVKITVQALSNITKLNNVIIVSILHKLVSNGEIYEDKSIPSNRGNPTRRYLYKYNCKHIVIIFSCEKENKTITIAEIIDLSGKPIYREKHTLECIRVKMFEYIIDKLIKKYHSISTIGFSMPGSEFSNIMSTNDYKYIKDTKFIKYYRKKYSIPAVLENNANSAIVGYSKRKNRKSIIHCVYIFP